MRENKGWGIGLVLVLLFIPAGEMIVIFRDYVYSRIGANASHVLATLWLIPVLAAFVAVSFSPRKQLWPAATYIPLISIWGPLLHYICGQAGVKIDLGGVAGLKVTFQIYLLLSIITVGIGCVAGIVFRTRR